MQSDWLNKKNNKQLIIFFNGWGSIIPNNLKYNDFDIIMFHNYQHFDAINIDFSSYEKKYLIAWSLGVYVCNFYYNYFKDCDGYTAINGTLLPIDNEFGININAYNLTIDNFNEFTCKKFMKKIGSNYEIKRDIENLKQELINIKQLNPIQFFKFNKIYISTKDKIFPYKNMISFWTKRNEKIIEIEGQHYIFNLFQNWSDLI